MIINTYLTELLQRVNETIKAEYLQQHLTNNRHTQNNSSYATKRLNLVVANLFFKSFKNPTCLQINYFSSPTNLFCILLMATNLPFSNKKYQDIFLYLQHLVKFTQNVTTDYQFVSYPKTSTLRLYLAANHLDSYHFSPIPRRLFFHKSTASLIW